MKQAFDVLMITQNVCTLNNICENTLDKLKFFSKHIKKKDFFK
jgi:hypothetical protein